MCTYFYMSFKERLIPPTYKADSCPGVSGSVTGGGYASYASASAEGHSSTGEKSGSVTKPTADSAHKFVMGERRFNVLIYGLKESNKGTSRHKREAEDLAAVGDVLAVLDIQSASAVRDCIRLGKYNSERNRPVLVKFTRSHDATLVMANRRKLASKPGISIRPDLPPEERRVQSLLLRERRGLITSGVSSKDILIRGNTLSVNRTKYGYVEGETFYKIPHVTPASPASTSTGAQANESSKDMNSPDLSQLSTHSSPTLDLASPTLPLTGQQPPSILRSSEPITNDK